ncbi:MAG TPA: hypothetical protein VLS85_11645 [Hanamia sp.]|nr:hypothetical protein [Hanamia sp.]
MKLFTGNEAITPVVQQLILPDQVKSEEGTEIKNPFLSYGVFFLVAFGILVLGYFTKSTITLIFGGLFTLVMVLGLIQTLIKKRVAGIMRRKGAQARASVTISGETIIQSEKATDIPLFQLAVYEQNELPDHGYTLNPHLSEEKNIFNMAPLPIFYFFNFYSTRSLLNKTSGGFQRHGPVFYLGSPADIGFTKLWQMFSITKIMNKLLLTSPEQLHESIDKSSVTPLPPKTKGLMAENYLNGAYPSNTFYCTDLIWQQCVSILFSKTKFAIIDACDYTAERAGLQWEIGQIINHISTSRFVVFINSKTDIAALGSSFRKCWNEMNADSPNNIENPLPLRFIFSQSPDKKRDNNFHKNILWAQYHEEALSNDNVVNMLLQSV